MLNETASCLLNSRSLLFLEDTVNKRCEGRHSAVTAAAPLTSATNIITKFSVYVSNIVHFCRLVMYLDVRSYA